MTICTDWVLLALELALSPPVQKILLCRLRELCQKYNQGRSQTYCSAVGVITSAASPVTSVSPLSTPWMVPTVSAMVINELP